MQPSFTAHNIRLSDGTMTKPEIGYRIDEHSNCAAARRMLDLLFPGERSRVRVADLGCLEGGYSVEFARMGFDTLGIDVRESNIAACEYVKARVDLPNLAFARDDVWNIEAHGPFDAIFCCGLFYHLDKPREFLQRLGGCARKLLMVQTHFSTADAKAVGNAAWSLSPLAENEGVPGRWYTEFNDERDFAAREANRWASWDNKTSFWLQKEYLLQAIHDAGFDIVTEQYDALAPTIAANLLSEDYIRGNRGMFVGIKSAAR